MRTTLTLTATVLAAALATAASTALAQDSYTCRADQTQPPTPVILVTVVPTIPVTAGAWHLADLATPSKAPVARGSAARLHVARESRDGTDAGDYWLDLASMRLERRLHGLAEPLGVCTTVPNF